MKMNALPIVVSLLFYSTLSTPAFSQSDDELVQKTRATLTDKNSEEPIDCGTSYLYFPKFDKMTSVKKDKKEFLASLLEMGKQVIAKAGFKCAECDDPSATGCDLEIKIVYAGELDIKEETNTQGEKSFTLIAQDLAFIISCTLCNGDTPDEAEQNEMKPANKQDAKTMADYHSVAQQTKCGETNYFTAILQGIVFKKGSMADAYESIVDMVEKNHLHFGFGCKLCPDGTKRCKVEVNRVDSDPGRNQLMRDPIKMDSTKDGIVVPVQAIAIVYFCKDCPDEKDKAKSDSDKDAIADEPEWQSLVPGLRVNQMILEPIIYEAGPDIDPHVHAYITYEVMPGDGIEFLNARLSDPSTGTSSWLIKNIPLLPFSSTQVISYKINVETFGSAYEFLQCDYNVGATWQTASQFPISGSIGLIPQPTLYNVSSGSNDEGLSVGAITSLALPPVIPGGMKFLERGCDMPNEDLDNSKNYPDNNPIPNDIGACGPAAAANSLQWLTDQHPELADESTSLRSKVDSLKKYMNLGKKDTFGVRFDSMVVGKLTLIDKLKLPISVKYQSKHKSANVEDPLASTEPPAHTADNHGKLGVYPDYDWLKKEMDDGEDVEVQVGWYGPIGDDGKRIRHGGHWVVVTGYFSSNMTKGIFIKDDNDQSNPGGLRHEYFEWAPGEIPYLLGMTDSNGNIAIIESVVSESYDPVMEDDFSPQYIHPSPLEDIYLTGDIMKPFYPMTILNERSFPWIPVITGVTGVGVVTYLITNEDKYQDCEFTVTSQFSNTTCGLSNGTASVIVSPTDDYQYQWSTGATTNNLNNVSAGNYSVTVTKTGTTCERVLSVTVTNSNPVFNTTFTVENAACNSSNGSIIAIVNPAGFYSITWSNGGTGEIQNNLQAGNYAVTVSAGGSCVENYNVTIEELPPAFELTVNTTPSECGQSTGTANIIVNPPGNYTYEWSNGSTGPQVGGLPTGEYNITVTLTGTSCARTIMANIGELPPNFEINVSTSPSNCGQANGTGNINVNPPGEYEYQWSNGSKGSNVSGLAAGEYIVTVSLTGTNCSKTIMATIDELPPGFEFTITPSPSECGQSNGSGTINVNPSGNYLYTWSHGATGSQATNLTPGNYAVSVTIEGTSCTKTATVIIEELPPTFTITSTTTPSACGVSTGTATITINPPGEYVYTWSNGATGSQVSNLAVGNYVVTVTINGTTCSLSHSVTIEQTGVEFTGTILTDAASCGIADGSAIITISPLGEYTYLWSDQQTGNVAQLLGAGIYTVVVTDMNSCTASFTATIAEDAADYISIDNIVPGTCIGDGDIHFTLTTPGQGPLIIQVVGPGGTGTITLVPGSYSLASFESLPSGEYSLSVFDEMIGQSCIDTVTITIPDNTPPLIATDDFYSTTIGQNVSGNLLSNDSGLLIEMTSVSNEIGGTVTFTNTGEFIFTPDAGFSGNASFVYTIVDQCGMSASALVTIFVEAVACNITIEVTMTPASCGLDDGEIFVEVIESGTYTYSWSNGDSGPQITNVYAGTYTITITEDNLGCSAEFTIDLAENPPDYISDIEITQPTCTESGEITFVAIAPGMNQLEMFIEHPNGEDLFFIVDGVVMLSDYVSITPGQYTIEVSDPAGGPDCMESFTVEIDQPPATIEIFLEAVFPPSEPTGMDGVAVIVVTHPGVPPYTVFFDGVPIFITSENTFFIQDLSVGQYEVFIQDVLGCESNILLVNVPPPTIILSLGTGVIYSSLASSSPEQSYKPQIALLSTSLISTLEYNVGGISQEWILLYVGNSGISHNNYARNQFVSLDYLTEITSFRWKSVQMKLQGGIGVKATNALGDPSSYDHQHWRIRASTKQSLGRYLQFQCSGSMQGWRKPDVAVIDCSLMFSLAGRNKTKYSWHLLR